MTVTNDSTQTQDEAQIRQLIADEASAICAKDIDRIMSYYDPDVVFLM